MLTAAAAAEQWSTGQSVTDDDAPPAAAETSIFIYLAITKANECNAKVLSETNTNAHKADSDKVCITYTLQGNLKRLSKISDWKRDRFTAKSSGCFH